VLPRVIELGLDWFPLPCLRHHFLLALKSPQTVQSIASSPVLALLPCLASCWMFLVLVVLAGP